jgi:8-oxo-dGTP pyrophosphatase MutT (NUDIX family)
MNAWDAWPRFVLDELPLGRLAPGHGELLAPLLLHARWRDGDLLWTPPPAERSALIQAAAEALHARGAIRGWRGEAYACEAPLDDPCAGRGAELFRLERAAFRFLGLMSRAVHINGWWPDGRMLCGRRAPHKATDPGKLDNLAAGGLTAGEDLLACARRELWEEAGVPAALSAALRPAGALRTTRAEPEGLHDEVLHMFDLSLPADFAPANRDGEVAEFLGLLPEELRRRLDAGEFSPDATLVARSGLCFGDGGRDDFRLC